MTETEYTRRDFLKTVSTGIAAMVVFNSLSCATRNSTGADRPSAAAETGATTVSTPADLQTYIGRSTRLSISMWDFSWLLAHHPGGAYEDLERRVAEAAERGYNTLRIDCFPSRILEKESTFEKNWEPGINIPRWGQVGQTFTCNVRQKVSHLANLCRKHGIWLGLDSWDKAHMFGHGTIFSKPAPAYAIATADEEREFSRYAEIWVRALKLMREDGVLERAVWVAPMNEVPHFSGNVESIKALRKRPLDDGETKSEKNAKEDDIFRRINHWMGEPIKAEIAREDIPLSYSSLGAERFGQRLTDVYDVVDIHFMPGVIVDTEDQAAFKAATRGIKPPHRFSEFEKMDLKAYSQAWDTACRKHYRQMLKRTRDYHANCLNNMTLPSGKRLTAINTEPFGPCFWPDHPQVGWEWYKRYNADALRVVAAMDLAGTALSNYAEPIFSLWNDRDWHWTSNAYFIEMTG